MREKIKKFLVEVLSGKRENFFIRFFKFFLLLLSFVYAFFVKAILFLYKINFLKKFKADCPLISIGNITVGGTGKTPFLIYLAGELLKREKKIVVVSRGYAEDETREVEFHLPSVGIWTGRNRVRGIEAAVRKDKPQYVLLDDGFQHWKVKRDLDIVTLDVSVPLERERVLPAGFLREPVSHLRRADVVLLTRVNLVGRRQTDRIRTVLKKINPHLEIYEVLFEPVNFYYFQEKKRIPLEDLRDESVGVFCGIGNPSAFVKTLEGINVRVSSTLFFLDHHLYTQDDLVLISRDSKEKKLGTYITTFKDISKIDVSGINARIYCLEVRAKFKEKRDENKFFGLIPGCLSG